ncbi:MAG: hypothetical protein OQJ97_12540 [Rhodospirillales bacterium]|nr:hypothetical protein [Rhodospirillales bacterium]
MSTEQDDKKLLTLALTTAAWKKWNKERTGHESSSLEINDFIKGMLTDLGEKNDPVSILYIATQEATLEQDLIDSFIEHSKIFDHFDGKG